MRIAIHKSLPEGYILAESAFDFVVMDLWGEGKGYEIVEQPYIVASPNGEFHEMYLWEHSQYTYMEKYVKNKQLYYKK